MSVTAEERILRLLKFRGPQRTEAVARHLGVTLPAARKQLEALRASGLLDSDDEALGRGRPKRSWSLTEKAAARFPDSHAVLTVEMIEAVRGLFGADGLDRLIGERERRTATRYGGELDRRVSLRDRLETLARLRSEEGYMAEVQESGDGGFLFVENHCPICAAARACQGFCRSELSTFRAALGADVHVERTEHILSGARRCAYRVCAAQGAAR